MKLQLFVLVVGAFLGVSRASSPVVNVAEGIIVGKTVRFSEDTFINKTVDVDVFLGVPYANPPARFAKPESKTPWTGERNATEFAPACVQIPDPLYPNRSEDCLYLNVYTPSTSSSNIPVMVWIHGGGFRTGTAMSYQFYGLPLVVVGDVIIVTINYRLSIFAHFTTGDGVSSGNYGMLDQVAAIEWVHNNIEAFGGDKDRITIFGGSVGSACVSFHLLSDLSRPHFNQAIMQSASSLANWAFRDDPELERQLARELGEAMGCDTSTSELLVSCLRTKDADDLRETADRVSLHHLRYPVTRDGDFLDASPQTLYQTGDFAHVPILAGFNKDEGTLNIYFANPEYVGSLTPPPINRATFDETLRTTLASDGIDDEIAINAVTQEYVDWTVADDPETDYFMSNKDVTGDMDFGCPIDMAIRKHAEAGYPVYLYYMTHEPSKSFFQKGDLVPSTPWLGAGHAEDQLFVWGMPFIDELYHIKGHNMTADENALSVKFMEFWTNFAKSGDPSKRSPSSDPGQGDDSWPTFTIPELSHKELALDLSVGRALRARQCHFWNEYFPSLLAFTETLDPVEQEWRESYDGWKTDMTEWQQAFEEYQQETTCD
ncbi:cholinesterase-like [Diadema setosum]|uniref:cholinesterase-like n=1 Tax=Diadema setosum TaxID=31175 RepID=UPI003B3ACE73